mgnify:CR=1 FL=1
MLLLISFKAGFLFPGHLESVPLIKSFALWIAFPPLRPFPQINILFLSIAAYLRPVYSLFSLLIRDEQSTKIDESTPKIQSISIEPYTNIAIEELQLSVRAFNCLKKAQINTVGDL